MNHRAPSILFARETPWNSCYAISTRKIAGEFAQSGWNVIWLTPPLMPWQREPNCEEEIEKFESFRCGGLFLEKNVFTYTPRSFVPFSRKVPFNHPLLADQIWSFCYPSILSVLSKANIPLPKVLWLSTFHSGGLKHLFPEARIVAHVHDNFSGYSSAPKTCKQIEKTLYQRAERIFTATSSLKKMLIDTQHIPAEKISMLPPGVDVEQYASPRQCPTELHILPHPRMVAIGNTTKLNSAILEELATNSAMPGSVVIIGPKTKQLNELAARTSRLHLIGPVANHRVADYLLHCDIGLILLGEHMAAAAEHTCPMKLYEYAAAGLPILSTPLPIYSCIDLPIQIVQHPSEVMTAIEHINNQRQYITPEMLDFSYQNSWKSRYTSLVEKLELTINT